MDQKLVYFRENTSDVQRRLSYEMRGSAPSNFLNGYVLVMCPYRFWGLGLKEFEDFEGSFKKAVTSFWMAISLFSMNWYLKGSTDSFLKVNFQKSYHTWCLHSDLCLWYNVIQDFSAIGLFNIQGGKMCPLEKVN